MRKNGFLVLGLMILHSALVAGDDRFGRNALFGAVQNNDLNWLATHVNQLPVMAAQVLESGEKIPKYDGLGMHLLHVFALHAKNLDFFTIGLEMFDSCGLDVDELEQPSRFHIDELVQCGPASALHYVYRRTNCSPKLKLQLIAKLLDHEASPFIESIDSNRALQNAYELTLSNDLLGVISNRRPWLLKNKKYISTMFSARIQH